ncbi:MAG: N-acetylmuramoyl-L-alanine amidase [Oscillospiraceae bacterium]|nr:N-acetylmuramoyl-L-alanine amidase [Oscillospiraceae bacterium]
MHLKKAALTLVLLTIISLATPYIFADTNSAHANTHVPNLSGRVIILDPGHGIGSTNIFRGYNEQVAMLNLALRIKPLLEAQGATVLMTRSTGENVTLPARTAMINIWALEALLEAHLKFTLQTEKDTANANSEQTLDTASEAEHTDLDTTYKIKRLIGIMQTIIDNPDDNATRLKNTPFDANRTAHPYLRQIFELQNDPLIAENFLVISLHSNATHRPINTRMHGATAYHISNAHTNTRHYFGGFAHEARSHDFATILLAHIERTGFQNLGPRSGNFFILREHNIPAVLAENGFHTNDNDRTRLMNSRFMDRLALAYLTAITEYFNNPPLQSYE